MPASTLTQTKTLDRDEILRRTPVNDIDKAYTAGQITYAQRGNILREKAIITNHEAFGDQGYMMAMRKIFIKELNKGFENFKEAAAWEAEAGDQGGMQKLKDELYYAGLSLWGQIQMLNALPSAFGQVNGLVAERMALQSGATAGLAKWIGISADFGSGFIPSAMAAKTTGNIIKGAQKVVGAGEKAAGAAERAAAQAAKLESEAAGMRNIVEDVIDQSLKADGVTKSVFSRAAVKGESIAEQAANIPRVDTTVSSAQKAAAEKLGVPTEEVHTLLTGWAPDKIAAGDIEGAAADFLRDTTRMTPEQAAGLKSVIQRFQDESGSLTLPENSWGKVTEIYRNLLLAGPAGRTKDLISNMVSTGLHVAQRQMGVIVGASGETTTMGTVYYAKGMALAIHEAFDSAASAFAKTGAAGTTKFDKPITREIPGLFGDIVNIPTSVTVGIDRGFKAIHRRGSLYAQELEAAAQQGRAFDIQNVDLPTKETWDKAVQISEYLTFQNELGTIGKNIAKGLQAGPGELYFPFLKTPIDLAKYTWNNTPGLQIASGRLWDELRRGGEAADMAMGRLTISNMFAFYVGELVKQDMITGSGPANADLRKAWLLTHEPYSVRKGDKWVPYPFIGPIAQTIGLISDFTQGMHDLDAPKIEQIGQAIMMAVEHNLGDSSWFHGVQEITNLATTLGQSDKSVVNLEKLLAKPFFTMATGGSAGATIKQFVDPLSREARSVSDSFYAKTAWGSTDVAAKRDGLGDIIIPPEVAGGRWAAALGNPVKTVEKPKDRIRLEADRLKVRFPDFGETVGGSTHEIDMKQPQPGQSGIGVRLTSQQLDERKQIYGNILEHPALGIGTVMDTEEYQGAPDALKRRMFEGNLRSSWKTAGDVLMEKYPTLRVKEIQNDAREVLPQLNEGAEKEDTKQEFQRATDYFQKLPPDQMDNILRFTPVD